MLLQILTDFICCEFKKIKTNLTMFLIFFWIIWFSQILAISTMFMSLPDITEIPSVTSGVHEYVDLPKDGLEVTHSPVDALLFDVSVESSSSPPENRLNNTLDILLPKGNSGEMQNDEQIVKINDSGGDPSSIPASMPAAHRNPAAEHIRSEQSVGATASSNTNATVSAHQQQQQQHQPMHEASSIPVPAATETADAEEVAIPLFSEWSQKQMEAAEKQQQLEQDVVNTSTQRKNNNNSNTNGNHKLPPLKLRAKNYASPDCGAKIIACNGDASNTWAVLSASKDEYMLSPCTNRIWFIVELCEAIQAQKIDLANFELFSSSPRNFTVAVSNRFPTRDWSNVGRFTADDSRTVQSFDLHPHLFGKFVRVDIHSHYSKEHFCPVSLFRVFGTSEFEAFETENHPDEDLDDFEDEFVLEQAHVKNSEKNLFKSASDAVLSIVKKAAEVLVMPASSNNSRPAAVHPPNTCQTRALGPFICAECSSALVARVNEVLSCKTKTLNELLHVERVQRELQNPLICAKSFGIKAASAVNEENRHSQKPSSYLLLHLLPLEYVGALCQILIENQQTLPLAAVTPPTQSGGGAEEAEVLMNFTIDRKQSQGDSNNIDHKLIATDDEAFQGVGQQPGKQSITINGQQQATTTESSLTQPEQLARPQLKSDAITAGTPPRTTTTAATATQSIADPQHDDAVARDVNIFNVNNEAYELPASTTTAAPATMATTTTPAPEVKLHTNGAKQKSVFEGSADFALSSEMLAGSAATGSTSAEDPSSWDSIDNLLTSTTMIPAAVGVATAAAGSASQQQHAANVGSAAGGGGGVGTNMQQKIPNGGPHSESIFIRLSNRIKALERNMSLSGQYLEELSRSYKKQVEELQQTLAQHTLNVRALEEQNRRHSEYEQLLSHHNLLLRNELADLALQLHAFIFVLIFLGAFVFLVVMVGILFTRSMRRDTRQLVALHKDLSMRKTATTDITATRRRIKRRQSFGGISHHQRTVYNDATTESFGSGQSSGDVSEKENVDGTENGSKPRQRKKSVYNGNNNLNNRCDECIVSDSSVAPIDKQQGAEQLQQLSSEKESSQAGERESAVSSRLSTRSHGPTAKNEDDSRSSAVKGSKSSKKNLMNAKRNISDPAGNFSRRLDAENDSLPKSHFDENVILDEDNLDNFLPGADLAYNEFMPEGPSGYQVQDSPTEPSQKSISQSKAEKAAKKSARRLSSPAFFKSPFSKNIKLKSTAFRPQATASHQSTSWEWYRSKKYEKHSQSATANSANNSHHPSASGGCHQRNSSAPIVGSSSLSDMNALTNSDENSFRILEEEVLSSKSGDEATTKSSSNGNGAGSSTTTIHTTSTPNNKKIRSFNNIFKRVF